MTALLSVLMVGIGGGAGAALRWWIGDMYSTVQARRAPQGQRRTDSPPIPWPTMIANVLACFLLGLVVVNLGSAEGAAALAYLLLAVGFCGGLSTLSTAALDAAQLVRGGSSVLATGYTLLTIGLCMAGLWLGVVIAS